MAEQLEGFDRADILRYLRHEMGHVVNYAYRLEEVEENHDRYFREHRVVAAPAVQKLARENGA